MQVTIQTDASHCPKHRVAGYAFWITCNRGRFGGGGEIVKPVSNNNVAEMMAIANALWYGIERGIIHPKDTLLIQSDSLRAMELLEGKREVIAHDEYDVRHYFRILIRTYDLSFKFRHVKAHTSVKDKRSISNRLCDRKAKHSMRLARERRVKETEHTPNDN